MSKLAVFSGPGGFLAGGAVAVGLAVIGVAIWGQMTRDEVAPVQAVQTAPVTSAADAAAKPEPAPAATGNAPAVVDDDAAGATAPDQAAAPADDTGPADTQAQAPAPRLPAFALVRIEPDGFTQVAGTAEPGGIVELLLDELKVGEAQVGTDGSFAALLDLPPSDAPRMMRLRMQLDGKDLSSDQEIIIAPSPVVQPAPADDATVSARADAVAPETDVEVDQESAAAELENTVPQTSGTPTAPPAAAQTAPAKTENPTDTAPEALARVESVPATEPPTAPAPGPETGESAAGARAADPAERPAVLLSDADGVRVLQPAQPRDTAPEVMSSVAIDAITYDEDGAVELAGRSPATGFVRVYLDNAPVTTSRIAPDGSWRTDLPQVDTGIYTLRVDQVSADGDVLSRVETPFKREDTAALAAANAANPTPARAITVQPGYTLWAIARDRYGEGTLYVEVFKANRDRIRDPDLIYPGQVFDLPEVE